MYTRVSTYISCSFVPTVLMCEIGRRKTQSAWIKKPRAAAIQGTVRQVVLERTSRRLGYFSASSSSSSASSFPSTTTSSSSFLLLLVVIKVNITEQNSNACLSLHNNMHTNASRLWRQCLSVCLSLRTELKNAQYFTNRLHDCSDLCVFWLPVLLEFP